VGVAALQNLYIIPETARTKLPGRKRKVGRPRKVARALIMD